MIVDTLDTFAAHTSTHPLFGQAFDFLINTDFSKIDPGTFVLVEGKLTATLMDVTGKQPEEAKLEAHRRFIDIQLVVDGSDTMGWSPLASCSHEVAGYDAEKDVVFYSDPVSTYIKVHPGQFVVFYPTDVHAPCIGEGTIRKVVVKVLV